MRVPVPDRITTTACRAESAAERSSAGSAWQSDPPIVPRFRTTGSAITRSASCSTGKCSPATADDEEVGVAGHRADDQIVTVDGDRAQLPDQIVDVDQVLRSGEAELHHREQAVPAGDHTRIRAELLEERDRMVDARRTFVRERCWNLHGYLLLWVRVPPRATRWLESRPESFAESTSRPGRPVANFRSVPSLRVRAGSLRFEAQAGDGDAHQISRRAG